ncbi:multicopper oxidase mco-like isoform X1 [Branchiostoma floridae x Branchiostoma belcheri]
MWTTASVLGLLCVFPLLTTACDNSDPCQFTGGDAFVPTAEVTSSNGGLAHTLTVDISDVTIEWLTVQRRTYNGGLPGPTFRLKAGDNFDVTLVNNLGPQPAGVHNDFRQPNTTNLHLHGLHISPLEPQDYVLLEVGPGDRYEFKFELNTDQQAGTFWYHSHYHGSTFFQVASGMAGLLIIEDEPSSMSAELAAISCPDNCDKEVPMLLGNFLYYSGGDAEVTFATMQNNMGDPFTLDDTVVTTAGVTLNDYLTDQQTGVSAYMVNGQVRPTITMQPGEIRRFRMVNAGPADMLLITITGCEITILAYDGVYVDTPYSQDFIFIPTGGRCDAAVRCATAGTYEIRSAEDTAHEPSIADTVIYGGVLATIQVAGASVSMNFPTATPAKPSHLEDLRTVEDSAIGGRYVVEVGPDPFLNREQFTNTTYYRYNFEVDTIQQWVFVNTNEEDGHPLHMHVNHFQVISYNPYNGPVTILGGGGGGSVVGADGTTGVEGFAYYDLNGNLCDQQHRLFDPNSLPALPVTVDTTFVGHDTNDRNLAGYARLGEYRDVLLIPPLGSVTVRFKAADYIGPYVLHCHILNHEDQGMMMVTYATPPGQATPSPWEASGGYNPGTCKATDVYPDILQNTSDGNKHAGVNT